MNTLRRIVFGLAVPVLLLSGCIQTLQPPAGSQTKPPAQEHIWNSGELTKPVTAQLAGEITYTCTVCGAVRHEEAAAGSRITTRGDLEAAVAEVAWDYFFKREKLQYCSAELDIVGKYYGGRYRITEGAAPEYGTAHTAINSVCSDYVWKTYYEALDYKLLGMEPLDAVTTAMWLFSKNQPEGAEIRTLTESDTDIALIRWAKEGYAWETAWGLSAADGATEAEMDAFLADWEKNLRPGDAVENNGHVMLYVGNGVVLHCGGLKYDPASGAEKHEKNGGIRIMSASEYADKEAGYYYRKHDRMVIFRPSYLLAPAGYDDDPGNDIVECELPARTLSRMKYPAMAIDRTVDITPYGTAVSGGTLTYTIRITNDSNDQNYRMYRGSSYTAEPYAGLLVTETVPAGTEVMEHSISSGGSFDASTGRITWNLQVPAGTTVRLDYQVRVTASVGSVITNSGGFVEQIPSNSIRNPVGGPKLTDHAQATAVLSGIQPSKEGGESGIDFVNRLYQTMGIALELPSVSDLVSNLFRWHSTAKQSASVRYEDASAVQVFTLLEAVPQGYQRIRDMMIPGFWGGYRFYTGTEARGTTICELREAYLEPGDILIWTAVNNAGAVTGHRVLLYTADRQLVSVTPAGARTVYSGADVERVLWQTLRNSNGLFFALRPTQINGK